MLNVENIFKNRVLNAEKLFKAGIIQEGGRYVITGELSGGRFLLYVFLKEDSLPEVRLIDAESGEEYVLIHASGASGGFVGPLIEACEEKLKHIAESFYDYRVFKSPQAGRIIEYVNDRYGGRLEFLWEKFPKNAVFRRNDTKKWYAILLSAARDKIGLKGGGFAEIIDLRAKPEIISGLIDNKKYFPGYHMNKRSWFTVCLDGSVETEEICRRIDESFILAV